MKFSLNIAIAFFAVFSSLLLGCNLETKRVNVEVTETTKDVSVTIRHSPSIIRLDTVAEVDAYKEEVEFLLETIQETRGKMMGIKDQKEKEDEQM